MSSIPQSGQDNNVVHTERAPLKGLPSNLTYRDLIARNKRNSAFIVVLMLFLITLFGGAVGAILAAWGGSANDQSLQVQTLVGGIVFGGIIGFGIAIIATVWSWFGGSDAILRMTGSREIAKSDDPQLFNVVEELAISGGVPMPKVYVIDSPALNAFATGRDPAHGAVAITTGLRQQLSRDELAGVIAHEISHIKHFDIRLGMLMATLAGIIVFAADAGSRAAFYGMLFGGGGRRGGRGTGWRC